MNTSGLKNFIKRVSSLASRGEELKDDIANAVANRGVEIATIEYSSEDVKVGKTQAVGGKSSVIASGKGVSFMEFGTGVKGEGTYNGNLPTQSITFPSKDKNGYPIEHTTQGWVYNYRKKELGATNDFIGFKANAQMFNTSQQLKREINTIVKNVVAKGDK